MITRFRDRFNGLVDDRSYALVTTSDASRAIVFVHGFTGHPGRTWRRIEDLLTSSWWQESDLFFFGYASVHEAIRETAGRLGVFLERLLSDPRDWIDQGAADAPRQTTSSAYQELVLVAHSQGGLIVRQVILDSLWDFLRNKRAPTAVESNIAAAELRLFAPALWGARVAGMKGLALASVGPGTVAKMMLGLSPSYKEMRQGSSLLVSLQRSTEKAFDRSPDTKALTAWIAWAARDVIVLPGHQYECDPKSIFLPMTSHRSVTRSLDPDSDVMRFIESGTRDGAR